MMGGLVTLGINRTIMVPVYHKDLKELGLTKYYELDLDVDMIREDLKQMRIMRINEMEEEIQKSINMTK